MPAAFSARQPHLDVLRVIASFAVVLIHVSTGFYYDADVRTLGWLAMNLYDGIARWAVPVFVMISGALFLSPEKQMDYRVLFQKNLIRIALAYGFWSALYALKQPSLPAFLNALIGGHYHMWYLPMLAGLYLLTPLLRKLTATNETMKYTLALGILFSIVLPTLADLIGQESLRTFISNFGLFSGYTMYFVLGHYLHSAPFSRKKRLWIITAGILGILGTLAGSSVLSYLAGKPMPDLFFGYFSPFVFFASAGIFVFFRYQYFSSASGKWMAKLSTLSFGIYLIHPMAIDLLEKMGFHVLLFPSILSVPLITLAAWFLSLAAAAFLNRIPFLRAVVR